MNSDEGIYLIHTREFISTNAQIYKIGRSNYLDNRVKQYPNGSKILLMIACKHSKFCENNLKKLFKSKFIQKSYYGSEYFEGNYIDMIKEICDYINNINVLSTEEINKIKKSKNKSKTNSKKKDEQLIKNKANKKIKKNDEIKDETKDETKDEKKIVNTNCDRTCLNCKHIFRFPSDLKKHLKISFHCKKTDVEIENFFNNINNNNKTKNKSVNCLICKKEFTRKESLERHLKTLRCSKPQNTK